MVCSMWVCAAALQLLVSVFLYTSIVPRPVEFVKWPGTAQSDPQKRVRRPGVGCCGVPFRLRLVALWFVWGGVWVVVC